MKITKRQLRRIIREERGEYVPPSPPGPGPNVEEIEKIADLMANDPEFEMFRKHVEKFKERAQSTSVGNALVSVLPEYMPGSLISDLLAKVHGPFRKRKSSPHPLAGVESDYDTPISGGMREMKISKRQLRRIIKEEKARLLNEVTPGEREEALKLADEDALRSKMQGMSDPKWSSKGPGGQHKGRNLELRNAIMDTYEAVYDDLISQGADESVAQDRASDAVMVEVEAWLDAVGIPRRYVGLY